VIMDACRNLYAQQGLSVCNTWNVLNPCSMYSVTGLGRMGRFEIDPQRVVIGGRLLVALLSTERDS
jgi:hypothetical protein